MSESTDVIVIGGGPAGSTAAALLAERGLGVRVLERERFPRFHIGESLLPYNAPLFRRLGVWDRLHDQGFQRKFGAQFLFEPGGERKRLDFRNSLDADLPMSFQVRRAELDRLLLQNARDRGAEVEEGVAVRRVLFDGERAVGVEVEGAAGEPRPMAARMVIDATGRDTLLGGQLGLKRKDDVLRQAALYCHVEGAEMGLGPDGGDILVVGGVDYGWFWMIPLDAETTSVGVVFPSRVAADVRGENGEAKGAARSSSELFDRLVARSPEVSRRLRGARRVREVEGAADFSYRCDRFAGDGYLMVGDAAGFLDPVFSSGVMLAMRTAERAADLLAPRLLKGRSVNRRDLLAYERFALRGFDRFRRYILAFYDPAGAFTFSQDPPGILARAVSSAFAGKVFERDPRVWLMEAVFFGHASRLRRREAAGALTLPEAPACR